MGLTSAMSTSRVSLILFRVPNSLPLTSCTHSEGAGTIYKMHKHNILTYANRYNLIVTVYMYVIEVRILKYNAAL